MGGRVTARSSCGRLGALLASSSVAALTIGGGAPAAFAAACVTQNGGTVPAVTNSVAISCINIFNNATVTGNVTNTGTGVIVAASHHTGIAVKNASIGGAVVNAGQISGIVGINVATAGMFGSTSVGSGITNSGTISVSFDGIAINTVSTFAGSVSNGSSGTISAGNTGIKINTVSIFTGGISNSGTISAVDTGIAVSTVSTFSGGISNGSSGTIAAGTNYGINIFSVSNFSGGISNAGTISSGNFTGIFISGVSTFSGGISNSGQITGTGFSGIGISGVATFTGGISNSSSGTVAGNGGIKVTNVTLFGSSIAGGGITNAGTIAAVTNGISINSISTFFGGVTNSGTIRASSGVGIAAGNVVSFLGGIVNSGTISAPTRSGITVYGFSTFGGGITNSGTISSGRAAIAVTSASQFSGGIGNAGTISTSGDGIEASVSTFANGITNSSGGTIAAGIGIAVVNITELGTVVTVSSFSGGITNNGMISAATNGIAVAGVSIFADGITNSGTISAVKSAISISGVSTFTGGIVNNGTISSLANFDAGIAVSNVNQFSNGIVNGGTISGYNGIAVTGVTQFGNGITNAGTISVSHNAIKVTNVPTFSGGISNNNGGSISAFTGINVSNVRQFTGGITNSGAITANKTGIFLGTITSFFGNVSNTGTITGVSAIRVLGGVTFAAGSAIVNSGTIAASSVAIDAHSATGAVTIDQVGGIINGAILLSSNAGLVNVNGGAINGNIIGMGSGDTVNFAPGAGNTFTYGSNFTGINQVNINSGTVVLNGSNVATNVDVNGGTLAGTGTLDPLSVTIHSGATLAPGAPGVAGGKLSIVGSLVLQSAATYLVTINGTSASSTGVTGTATLGGARVSLANGSTVVPGLKYTILTDTGGGLGGANTFAGTVSSSKYKGTLSYDADDVFLTFQSATLRSLLAPGAPINITNTVAAIDDFTNSGGSAPAAFQNLANLSPAQLQSALAQLSGEAATGAERGAFQMTTSFLELTLDPFVAGRGGNSAGGPALGFAPEEGANVPDDVARAYASIFGKAMPASFQQRWSEWSAAYGGNSSSRGDPTAGCNTVTASAFGFAGGVDYHVTASTLVGIALAGGGTGWGLANALGGGRSDALQVGGYGISWFGPAYLAGALSFSNHWFTTNRTALGDQLTASFIGQSYGARVEGGYRYGVVPTLGVTPYGAVQAQAFHTPAYSERDPSGGGFGLSYGARNATDLRTELGARFDAPTLVYGKPLIFYGRAAWAHDFVSAPTLGAVFVSLPGAGFAVNGAPIPHDSALTSVGAQLHVSANWSLTGTFNGDFASASQTYGGSGTLSHTW